MAFEYTPEINAEYVKALKQPMIQQGAMDVGKARGEALRRGLEGDPFEALRVGAAKNTMNTNMANLDANVAYQTAGLKREERMGTEDFNRQALFTSQEAEKTRNFQERMAIMQQNYESAVRRAQERAQQRMYWPTQIGNFVSGGAGMYLGNKLGQ